MSDTKVIKIGDVSFTIGFIPAKIWKKLRYQKLSAAEKGLDLLKGLTPEELTKVRAGEITPQMVEKINPQAVMDQETALFEVDWEIVRHGVRGHDGIVGPDGAKIEPVLVDGILQNCTLELYDLNGFFKQLAVEVFAYNTLREQQIKN